MKKKDLRAAPPQSNASHTPGPWRAEYDGIDAHWKVVAVGELDWVIGDAAMYADPDHTGEANAKLMAAAPTMADMLYEQWELERCEDATCVDHGPLISVLWAAGRLAEDVPKAPNDE